MRRFGQVIRVRPESLARYAFPTGAEWAGNAEAPAR